MTKLLAEIYSLLFALGSLGIVAGWLLDEDQVFWWSFGAVWLAGLIGLPVMRAVNDKL